jgi:hypothetical protein
MASSNKQIAFAISTPYPSWLDTALPQWEEGTWKQIGGQTPDFGLGATRRIADNPTGISSLGNQNCVCKNWNGAVWQSVATSDAPYGGLILGGGGHDDYHGDEVYRWNALTRHVDRLTDPYPTPSFPIFEGWWPAHSGPLGSQPNGSPASPHTYDHHLYDESRNEWWWLRRQDNNTGSSNVPSISRFSVVSKQWTRGPWLSGAGTYGSGGWSSRDTIRDRIVLHGGGGLNTSPNLVSINCATQAFTIHTGSNHSNLAQLYGMAAFSPVDDMHAIVRGGDGASVWALPGNLPTTGANAVQLSITNPTAVTGEGHGWEWTSVRQAFLRKPTNGPDVWQLKKNGTGPGISSTWTWTNLLSASNTVLPQDMEANAIFSKFQPASFGGGTIEVCVMIKRTTGPTYGFLSRKP